MLNKSQKVIFTNHFEIIQVESGKLVLEDAEFDLGRELEGLIDMFSVQCINHNVEAVLDLSGTYCALNVKYQRMIISLFLMFIATCISCMQMRCRN
jgi:hypothetical protein